MANLGTNRFLSTTTIAAISAGGTSGLGLLVSHVAFATLIFSGALAPHSSQGIGFILFGCFSGCLIIALLGGFRGAIAGLSPALVVAMVHIGASMNVPDEALFVTTIVALAVSAAITGLLCFPGWKVRTHPSGTFYPVSGGKWIRRGYRRRGVSDSDRCRWRRFKLANCVEAS